MMPDRDQTVERAGTFGDFLRRWRRRRGTSQLALAVACGVSQRHLSFLESGRANPSRAMVLHLASALAVPLRQQNEMLLAAGFAPIYAERDLAAPDLAPISRALDRVLAQHMPYPAAVVDRRYNLIRANDGARRLLSFLLDGQADGEATINLLVLLLAPGGLRPVIENWEEVATWLVRRLRAETVMEGFRIDDEDEISRLFALPEVARLWRTPRESGDEAPYLTVRFRRGGVRLSLFSMIASIGTPLDVGLQELRIEYFFPADDATERWFAGATD